MIIDALTTQYDNAVKRGWNKIYVAVDIHQTMIYSNYNSEILPKEFYPMAKETLIMLSKRKDICLILSTCSWPAEILKYLKYFEEYEIDFKYANKNPEVVNDRLGYFSDKFYFNVLLEDKAGFVGESDWQVVYNFFQSHPILEGKKPDAEKQAI